MKEYYVYIIANKPNGTIYTGVTSNLKKRVWEHQAKLVSGFSSKYHIHILVYYETFINPYTAITREKTIKHWKRQWRINLIEKSNPRWEDLSCKLF